MKIPIRVILEDDNVIVSCATGDWVYSKVNSPWLWVLGAVAFPDEYSITINDVRQNRQDHQKDMTTWEEE